MGIDQKARRPGAARSRGSPTPRPGPSARRGRRRPPVVLALVYYAARGCAGSSHGVVRAVTPCPGSSRVRDYRLVAVSIDPALRELAREASAILRSSSIVRPPPLPFLVAPAVRELAAASLPLRARSVPASSARQRIVCSHPTVACRAYLYGVEYSARDLRLALVEAAAGASARSDALLLTARVRSGSGRYTLAVLNLCARERRHSRSARGVGRRDAAPRARA